MTPNPFNDSLDLMKRAISWVTSTPERAIDAAYRSAINIKKLEDEYFGGERVNEDAGYSENTYSLFRAQLRKYLRIIDLRLLEYRVSSLFGLSDRATALPAKPLGKEILYGEVDCSVPQKLAFIDLVVARYRLQSQAQPESPPAVELIDTTAIAPENKDDRKPFVFFPLSSQNEEENPTLLPIEKSILPGSFSRTFKRIRFNLGGSYTDYEKCVVEELRQSRQRTSKAARYIAILIAITVSVQQVSKYAIFSPIVDAWNQKGQLEVRFRGNLEEEALAKFHRMKEKAEFERILTSALGRPVTVSQAEGFYGSDVGVGESEGHLSPKGTAEDSEVAIQNAVVKLYEEYRLRSLDGIKNLFADITAIGGFYVTAVVTRKQWRFIKDFVDETLYSLNDSAKAFLIIVATDTFVGYHSSDGWEALLEVMFAHYGLPENRTFLLTFIATVPVFLDGLFKFWIFQYLRQASPSTSAIFSEMNN